jgi:hypothetical protein
MWPAMSATVNQDLQVNMAFKLLLTKKYKGKWISREESVRREKQREGNVLKSLWQAAPRPRKQTKLAFIALFLAK